MDDLTKRQQAMDAYQQRLNEMQKMDFRKAKEELDQAKVEKMHADVFKTKVSTQKTIIDAQSALQQIQMQQQQPAQPQQPMQVQAAMRRGYAGVTEGKLSEQAFKDNEKKLSAKKGKEQFAPMGGSLSLQLDADKLSGKAGNLPAWTRLEGSNDYYAKKSKGTPLPQKLLKDAAPIGKSVMDALKMENSAGWALMPGLGGAALGGVLGSAYSGFDPKYALGDAAKGAVIGGGIGALFGHNYGKNKLKDMLGGTLDASKGQNPYSLKAIKNTDVNAVLKERGAAAAQEAEKAQRVAEQMRAEATQAARRQPRTTAQYATDYPLYDNRINSLLQPRGTAGMDPAFNDLPDAIKAKLLPQVRAEFNSMYGSLGLPTFS